MSENELIKAIASEVLYSRHHPGVTQTLPQISERDTDTARSIIARVRQHDASRSAAVQVNARERDWISGVDHAATRLRERADLAGDGQ